MRSHRFVLSQIAYSYVATLVVALAGLAAFRLASLRFGEVGFVEYSALRRALGLLSPLVLFGLGVTLPRLVSRRAARNAGRLSVGMAEALAVVVLLNVVVACSAALAPVRMSELIFGTAALRPMLPGFVVMLLGGSVAVLPYALLRGKLEMRSAAAYWAVSSGVALILGMSLGGSSLSSALIVTGILQVACAVAAFGFLSIPPRELFRVRARMVRMLAIHGSRRLPGDVGLGLLLWMPGVFVTSRQGIAVGGYVGFIGTVLAVAGTALQPISTALLPLVSQRFVLRGQSNGSFVLIIASVAASFGVIAAAPLLIAPEVVGELLGLELPTGALSVIRSGAFAVVPYALYLGLRSVVDGASTNYANSVSLSLGAGFCLVLLWVPLRSSPGHYAVYALAASLCVVVVAQSYFLRFAVSRRAETVNN